MAYNIVVRLKSGKEFNFFVDSYKITENDLGVNLKYENARYGDVPIYMAPGSIESISRIQPQSPDTGKRLNGGI